MRLKSKTAIITGASSGIGKATAKLFALAGAQVSLMSRNRERLERLAEEIVQLGGEALVAAGDVTNEADCTRTLSATVSHYGKLDILVNAAGIIEMGSIQQTSMAAWHKMMEVNVTSVMRLTQLAIPHLQESRGNVVNVSSVTGVRAFANVFAYCVSKAALDQLTRCAALDLAPAGVRVNAVNPGVVVTNLHRASGMNDEQYHAFLERGKETHPLGRVGEAKEIAEAILYLASDEAKWITGVTLSIDGGRHLTCAR